MAHTFMTTLCQSLLFGAIFLAYVVFIPWPANEWILLIARIGLPILVSILYCFIMHRHSFRFKLENMTRKHSVLRIVSRVIGIFFVLIIGYIVDMSHILSNVVLEGYGDTIVSVVGNFNFYICVSLFLLVFALVEYIFVADTKSQTQT